jgi:hypothetical protein
VLRDAAVRGEAAAHRAIAARNGTLGMPEPEYRMACLRALPTAAPQREANP